MQLEPREQSNETGDAVVLIGNRPHVLYQIIRVEALADPRQKDIKEVVKDRSSIRSARKPKPE
jgi:hypothetical protein